MLAYILYKLFGYITLENWTIYNFSKKAKTMLRSGWATGSKLIITQDFDNQHIFEARDNKGTLIYTVNLEGEYTIRKSL